MTLRIQRVVNAFDDSLIFERYCSLRVTASSTIIFHFTKSCTYDSVCQLLHYIYVLYITRKLQTSMGPSRTIISLPLCLRLRILLAILVMLFPLSSIQKRVICVAYCCAQNLKQRKGKESNSPFLHTVDVK